MIVKVSSRIQLLEICPKTNFRLKRDGVWCVTLIETFSADDSCMSWINRKIYNQNIFLLFGNRGNGIRNRRSSYKVSGRAFDMTIVSRNTRRKIFIFLFAIIYALIFFEVGIIYQENYGKKTNRTSEIWRRRELEIDFHHRPDVLIESVSRGEEITKTALDDSLRAIIKTTRPSYSVNKRKYPRQGDSDILEFWIILILNFSDRKC